MPRIKDEVLDCTFYLYPSVASARAGERIGGTGFLVAVPSEVLTDVAYFYAVTNSHVVREGDSPVIRLNTLAGDVDVLELTAADWYDHPDGDDIAVVPLWLSNEVFKFKCLSTTMFATTKINENFKIGPGDDVFMVGRFVNHEGKQRNRPTVRSGIIAMMPEEGIVHPTRGISQESYLVETHSVPGYSGSPVFIAGFLQGTPRYGFDGLATENMGPFFLGIDWCHIPSKADVLDSDKHKVEDYWVNLNTGMMGVIPAWRLLDLLNVNELKMQRDSLDEQGKRKREEAQSAAQLDVAEPPFSKQEFESALKKVSRRATPLPPDGASTSRR